MEQQPGDRISVIIPVYNVEKELPGCLNSVFAQTYQNLEIILVDDGSTDESGRLCDDFSKQDDRVVVIHKKNGGLSSARNAGLDIATGSYIGYVDSDDEIKPQMYEKMYFALVQSGAQAAICGIEMFGQESDVIRQITDTSQTMDGRETQFRYFQNPDNQVLYTTAWNKLYDRNLIGDLRFPDGKIREDEFLTGRVLYRAKKVVVVSDAQYRYRVREKSIMSSFHEKHFDLFDAYLTRLSFFESEKDYELWEKTLGIYLHMFEQYVEWQKERNLHFDEITSEYRKKIKEYCRSSAFKAKGRLKIEFMVSSTLPSVYHVLWKKLRKTGG